MNPIALNYAPSPLGPRSRFFIFLLPLLWLPASIGSRIYYGDEYGAFVLAHLPALPVFVLLESALPIRYLFPVGMLFNLVVVVLFGHVLDRLRLPHWTVLLLPILLLLTILSCVFIPGNIPPRANPPPGLKWYPTSVFPAWAWTIYLSTLAAIILVPTVRLFRRSS